MKKAHVGNKKRLQSRRSSCQIKRPDDRLISSTSAAADALQRDTSADSAHRPVFFSCFFFLLFNACKVQQLICVYVPTVAVTVLPVTLAFAARS